GRPDVPLPRLPAARRALQPGRGLRLDVSRNRRRRYARATPCPRSRLSRPRRDGDLALRAGDHGRSSDDHARRTGELRGRRRTAPRTRAGRGRRGRSATRRAPFSPARRSRDRALARTRPRRPRPALPGRSGVAGAATDGQQRARYRQVGLAIDLPRSPLEQPLVAERTPPPSLPEPQPELHRQRVAASPRARITRTRLTACCTTERGTRTVASLTSVRRS